MRHKGMLKNDNVVLGIQYQWRKYSSEKKEEGRKENEQKKRPK